MDPQKPHVTNPGVDVIELLRYIMGDTGEIHEVMSGFRIHVLHSKGFPWDEVLKTLLYRDFRVYINRRKADIMIEATV